MRVPPQARALLAISAHWATTALHDIALTAGISAGALMVIFLVLARVHSSWWFIGVSIVGVLVFVGLVIFAIVKIMIAGIRRSETSAQKAGVAEFTMSLMDAANLGGKKRSLVALNVVWSLLTRRGEYVKSLVTLLTGGPQRFNAVIRLFSGPALDSDSSLALEAD